MKQRKYAVTFVLLCTIFALLIAGFLCVLHLHDGTDHNDCPVCALIHRFEGAVRSFAAVLSYNLNFSTALICPVFLILILKGENTLTARKIRLNN